MAGKIKVMCTSTGCIEYAPERYRKYDIDIIRIHVNFKGKEYLEGLDLDPVEFYNELEKLDDPKNNLPFTAMPTREAIMAHYDKAIADGYDEAIVIAISSGCGGTYNLLRLIAEEYADKIKITVIDSKITCFGEGLLAIKAAELAEKGVDGETIVKEIRWMMKHQEFLGVDGRLDYLIYNGRLKGGKALMGKMLSICPVIHFNKEGEIVSLQSVRTQKKALKQTCEILKEIIGDRAPEDYLLWHVYTGTTLLTELVEIEKAYDIKTNHEDVIMSPVSGAHNGPWLAGYGLAFIRREDEPLDEEV
ncbi:MAG: DegV family protein [Ruminococcaceae bacterium]|nr:DegV family protein [Oscillospiraceae bacterium]